LFFDLSLSVRIFSVFFSSQKKPHDAMKTVNAPPHQHNLAQARHCARRPKKKIMTIFQLSLVVSYSDATASTPGFTVDCGHCGMTVFVLGGKVVIWKQCRNKAYQVIMSEQKSTGRYPPRLPTKLSKVELGMMRTSLRSRSSHKSTDDKPKIAKGSKIRKLRSRLQQT
jgi:1,2-phenylacetyl-CoA epoxidase PaaB subunit